LRGTLAQQWRNSLSGHELFLCRNKLFDRSESAGSGVGVTFGELFTIKRGLATGDNEFFILSEGKAKELGIPRRFLRPILPPPPSLVG
jgi:hypothetical protein